MSTMEWKKIYLKSEELREKYPGCNVISEPAFSKLTEGTQAGDWWFTWLTMAPQHGRKVSSVLMVEKQLTGDSCLSGPGDLFKHEGVSVKMDLTLVKTSPYRWIDLNLESGEIEEKMVYR